MFGFENAELTKNNFKQSIEPGVHVVKITNVTNGLSTQKQSPYLEITVEGSNGQAELKQQYYLGTDIAPGKKYAAWDISKNAILSIVAAANTMDEATAKTKMPNAKSAEELAQKIGMLIVGKEMRLKVNGEEKISQKGTKYTASSFGIGVFCASSKNEDVKLLFNPDKNIKKLAIQPAGSTTEAHAAFSSNPANSNVQF